MSFGKPRDDKEIVLGSLGAVSSTTKPEAFLGKGCKISGRLEFTGPVEIDCSVEGEIVADKLTIGETGVIKAQLFGAEVVVRGTVDGDIVASKKIVLKRPAKVTGNLVSPVISMEEGVTFEGKCSMTQSSKVTELRPSGQISLNQSDKVA